MAISNTSTLPRRNGAMPKALPGFEAIKRYWDPQRQVFAAKILPGEYYVTAGDEMITTVLGSCVSACIRDKALGIGGMNHFMLPVQTNEGGAWENTSCNAATRYGNFAMEHLINDILKLGGSRKNLEIKLFGGGKVLTAMTEVGRRNISFVKEFLATEGLKITGQDLAGLYPRKVVYFVASGEALVKKLQSMHNDTIVKREKEYLNDLQQEPICGEIDLF